MTELELYKFLEEKEYCWRGRELVVWLFLFDLENFTKMVGVGYFLEDGDGLSVNLQGDRVAFDLVPICEYYGIEPENILARGA